MAEAIFRVSVSLYGVHCTVARVVSYGYVQSSVVTKLRRLKALIPLYSYIPPTCLRTKFFMANVVCMLHYWFDMQIRTSLDIYVDCLAISGLTLIIITTWLCLLQFSLTTLLS